ncbi:helix-turn-helix domain-containing protein [Olleya namhaensis]|uniref:helix-turn-helix domain-containing protein n=1 Tax=Olleya namhaensis TaxID=1144750 RepID=UPI002491CDF3|nr:helix-turn-helix domain-containing protein [Olleya namhaensis]
MKTKNEHWLKKSYQKATLETKLLVIDQILNGQISNNQASKKYDIPRTTISYLVKKIQYLIETKRFTNKQLS